MKTVAFRAQHRNQRASRRLCALTLIGALALPASAQDATTPLGRLFFTPERRQALDRQRQLAPPERPELSADPTLTINGVVTRSGGKRTVWINGIAHDENRADVVVTPKRNEPSQVVVHAADTPAANARVGDTVNRHSGETSGLLDGGSIKLGRPQTAGSK